MKNVISYRTEDYKELQKISKIRNISLSTLTAEIIHNHLNDHTSRKSYDMFIDGRKFISNTFDFIDESDFDQIATIGAKEYARSAKMNMNDFSLENLLLYFREWITINNLKLSEFDEEERVRWVCETNMGENYNAISAKIFKKVLDKFGFYSHIESICNEDYEIIFLKNKAEK